MARLQASAQQAAAQRLSNLAPGADDERDEMYSQIPATLRPSAWRQWEDELGAIPDPTRDDEVAAGYGTTVEKLATLTEFPPLSEHWRELLAAERHTAAYLEWLAERGLALLTDGTPTHAVRGWRMSDVALWERGCAR